MHTCCLSFVDFFVSLMMCKINVLLQSFSQNTSLDDDMTCAAFIKIAVNLNQIVDS